MRVLVLGLNYAPEPVGIGPYTADMAAYLQRRGHQVRVIAGKPYYPHWRVAPAFRGKGVRRSSERGVEVVRVPHYVPKTPTGARRLLHHVTFAVRALAPMVGSARRFRPDVVVTVAPSLIAATVAVFAARLSRARLWLHIQDFEVEAAFATGLLNRDGALTRLAFWFEAWLLRQADQLSTISPQMCDKLVAKGAPAEKINEFRNWASIEDVEPLKAPSVFRAEWAITRPHVALYSGNIANKQGIEIVLEAARLLSRRQDIQFVICGNGSNRDALILWSDGLDNVLFRDLQPKERLGELLGLASVHLLPQRGSAADLVLPSKLTNMLASGRPIAATALPGTGLAAEVEGCGLLSPPEDAEALASSIERLIDDPDLADELGATGRRRAVERWSRDMILARFESRLERLSAA